LGGEKTLLAQKKISTYTKEIIMSIGPLQLVVIASDKPKPDGSVIAELNAIRDQGFIRLVDALGVYKDKEGAVWAVEVSDLDEDEVKLAGAAIGAMMGFGVAGKDGLRVGAAAGADRAADLYEYGMDPDQIAGIADQIPEGGAALMMLIEHVWLTPLRNAIRAQGGRFLTHEFLSLEVLAGIGAELAMLEELEEE